MGRSGEDELDIWTKWFGRIVPCPFHELDEVSEIEVHDIGVNLLAFELARGPDREELVADLFGHERQRWLGGLPV